MRNTIFGGIALGTCVMLAGSVAVALAQDASPTEAEAEAASIEVSDEVMAQGAAVYENQCVACHGAEGQGGSGVPLAANGFLGMTGPMLSQIINGGAYMPDFYSLSDSDIAAVATYIRNSFGNEFDPIAEEEVADFR